MVEFFSNLLVVGEPEVAASWLRDLESRDQRGEFLAYLTVFVVAGQM